MLSIRLHLVLDICEPLVLFLLGYHTVPEGLFSGLSGSGVHRKDIGKQWALQERDGELVVTDTARTGGAE